MVKRKRRIRGAAVATAVLPWVAMFAPSVAQADPIGPGQEDPSQYAFSDEGQPHSFIDVSVSAPAPGLITAFHYVDNGAASRTPDGQLLCGSPQSQPQVQCRVGFFSTTPTGRFASSALDGSRQTGPNTVPETNFVLPQGGALGFDESSGIINYKYGPDKVYAQSGSGASVFTYGPPHYYNYDFYADDDLATQIVAGPTSQTDIGDTRYTVQFEDAAGTVIPDPYEAANLTLSGDDYATTFTDCNGGVISSPVSLGAGVYGFCVDGGADGRNNVVVADPGNGSITPYTDTLPEYFFPFLALAPNPTEHSITIGTPVAGPGSVQAPVTCVSGSRCRIVETLRQPHRRGTLGRLSTTLKAGEKKRLTITLGSAGRALVRRHHFVEVILNVVGTTHGKKTSRSAVVTVGRQPVAVVRIRQTANATYAIKHVTIHPDQTLELNFEGSWYDGGYAWYRTAGPGSSRLQRLGAKTVDPKRCCGFPSQSEFLYRGGQPGATSVTYTLKGPDGRPAKAGQVKFDVTVR